MAFIHIQNLSFSYPLQEKKTLDDISLSIEEGEFIVLCGSTGCGKSTLLKHLKKDLAPHGEKTGELFYQGINIQEIDERTLASDIGFVMQNPDHQIVTDKVWHELAFGLENLGLPSSIIRRRVAEMASFFGIQNWYRKSTADLSGGQKQLLNLASIMVMNPKVLILDEPTSQLDPIAASEFINTLVKINKELSLTILLVEHQLEEVFSHADRVALLDKGKLIGYDKPEKVGDILKSSQNPHHPMLWALPTPIRVYNGLHGLDSCPLTLRQGRDWLSKNFSPVPAPIEIQKQKDSSKEVVLELKEVWFRYKKDLPDVLENLSLKAYQGEILSILGGNGVGKTTVLGLLSGLYHPYRGKVLLKGKNIKKYGEKKLYHRNLAMLPQNPQNIFVENSVEREFKEMTKAMKYSKIEAQEKTQKIIRQLGIEELLSKHPYDLSGGEQQKVALAKILLLEPQILLLDEPTKGIDAYYKREFAEILFQLKSQGVTIIMVSHDIEFSAQYSDRCAMVFDGDIVSQEDVFTFFRENHFYTTAANRMARHIFPHVITCEDVIHSCKSNQRKVI